MGERRQNVSGKIMMMIRLYSSKVFVSRPHNESCLFLKFIEPSSFTFKDSCWISFYCTHRILDDRMEKYGSLFVFISK